MVPTFPLDPSALRTGRPLFPASIIEEPLTAYHGTSGQFGERIERDGLQADVMALQREDLAAVAHVFEQMRWCGVAWDGYAILRPFSLDFDYATADGRQRRVYPAENSFRAATYAGVGFAGGEAVRAVRLSLCDLQQYVDDPEVRKE